MGCTGADGLQQRRVGLRRFAAVRVKAVYDVVGEGFELGVLAGVAEVLEMPEAPPTLTPPIRIRPALGTVVAAEMSSTSKYRNSMLRPQHKRRRA
jgi:hypothetical protein